MTQVQEKLLPLLKQWRTAKAEPTFSNDTAHVSLLNNIAKQYMFKKPDSALFFARQAFNIAVDLTFPFGEALALNSMGTAYYIKGAYPKALDAYIRSRSIFEELNNQNKVAWALNNIGLIYIAQEDFDDAIKQYGKIIEQEHIEQDSMLFATSYFNLGLCHYFLSDLDSAVHYLNKSLFISRRVGSQRMISTGLNRLAEIYTDTKEFEKAIKYYRQVLENPDYQNNWENVLAHAGLSRAYFETRRLDLAIEHGEMSFDLAREMNAQWDATQVLKVLSDSYAEKGLFEQAYRYHMLHKEYSDSLYSEAKEKELNRLRLEQKEKENVVLEQAIETSRQKNRINRILIAVISIKALFLIFLVFRVYRNNRLKSRLNSELQKKNDNIELQKRKIENQNTILETLNKTKGKLLSIISHDLKSPLASIMATLNLVRLGALSKDEQKMVFSGLHNKVIIVSQMLDNLLNWANSQQMGIDVYLTKVNLPAAVAQVLSVANLLAEEKSIKINNSLSDEVFIYADVNHVRIIVQNLVSNAVKFTHKGGIIDIALTEKGDYCILHIKDDGVGMSEAKVDKLFHTVGNRISDAGTNREGGTGIGLMLIAQFIRENSGKIEVTSELGKGTEFRVYFKKYEYGAMKIENKEARPLGERAS